jgi:xanthine dehydrogenase accessory factor
MTPADLDTVRRCRAEARPIAVVTALATGAQALVQESAASGALPLPAPALEAVRRRLREDRSGRLEEYDPDWFVRVYNAPLKLVIVGAVHVAQALIPLATVLGYRITVIDARAAFATDERFPNVEMTTDWPDVALARVAPDRRTAIVTLTHDPKFDDPALVAALRSEAFFVGALGSRRTHAARVERLRAAGLPDAAIARIHAPVGLDLGGRLPSEIALAILAQMTQALRRPAGTTAD